MIGLEGKEPSVSDKSTINTVGVTRISIQFFTNRKQIGCKSKDLHVDKRIQTTHLITNDTS